MKSVALTAYPRSARGRNQVKQRRAAQRVPAVIYGRRIQPRSLELERKALDDVLHGAASESVLIDLTIEGEGTGPRLALIKEVQHHPLSRAVLHVDLHEVAADEPVTVTVPVETIGEAAGVKAGGVLEHVRFRVDLRGLPRELPEVLEIDVTALEIGQIITIGDLPCPPGVTVLGPREVPVILVAAPTKEEEVATPEAGAAVEGEAAQPEVITARKEGEGEK